ncbi:MAG: hypothetical protein HY706_20055 [Candidatus Hydrogenedentes bacterium]|nr:hypothetical protein [Candidatus Hydrogenedentota bacterium]
MRICESLYSDDPQVRSLACDVLVRLVRPPEWPTREYRLDSWNLSENVKNWSTLCEAILSVHPAICEQLSAIDSEAQGSTSAIWLIGLFRCDRAFELLDEKVRRPEPKPALVVTLLALKQLNGERYRAVLREVHLGLRDSVMAPWPYKDAEAYRFAILDEVVEVMPDETIEWLKGLLLGDQVTPGFRRFITKWSYRGPRPSGDVLLAALNKEHDLPGVSRAATLRVFAARSGTQALKPICEYFRDRVSSVGDGAWKLNEYEMHLLSELAHLGGPEQLPLVAEIWKKASGKHRQANVLASAASAGYSTDTVEEKEQLLRFAETASKGSIERKLAVVALSQVGPRFRKEPALRQHLGTIMLAYFLDGDQPEEAMWILARLQDDRLIPELVRQLEEDRSSENFQIVAALGSFHTHEAATELMRTYGSATNPLSRGAIASVLSNFVDTRVPEFARRALKTENDPNVRRVLQRCIPDTGGLKVLTMREKVTVAFLTLLLGMLLAKEFYRHRFRRSVAYSSPKHSG